MFKPRLFEIGPRDCPHPEIIAIPNRLAFLHILCDAIFVKRKAIKENSYRFNGIRLHKRI
ncbi:hypothetical protein HmCmsJML164_01134 [Escherichia coli]|nr:hypothetical protein HmCmsJML164_01134 [Escherichia coli]